jgi:protoporphyrin/coproporphyrin ferrochelatase
VKQAVLLAAHGAPERLEDVPEYLANVRGGRAASPEILNEVLERYRAIGGSSPLLRWTRAQATALSTSLGLPVFFGMRNWRPFLRETAAEVRDAGIERLAAICLAPQESAQTVGLYRRATETALCEAGAGAGVVWAPGFHIHPQLIEAFAERLAPVAAGRTVIFTAHSLPARALAPGDPYDRQCRATAAAVAARLGLPGFEFAYQSQGLSGGEWLGPTVESVLDRCSGEVVIAPVGFVCDHVEVLYDIDIHFRGYAAARGITVTRPESLNDSAAFTAALAEVARQCLA